MSVGIESISTPEKVDLPVINWSKDFPFGELVPTATGTGILIIAIDTEYQGNYTSYKNLCLSYQFSAYDMKTGTHKSGIFYMNVNIEERLTLAKFTKLVLADMNISVSTLSGYRIMYVGHFFAAEWAMLEDRNQLFMKFELIRKTLCTTKPLTGSISDENGAKVDLYFEVKDTMLLLPEGYKSLDAASTFIPGFEKIDLPIEVKSKMYQFLQAEPELFEEYAIRDAQVTLRLFIKLQYLLNTINGTTSQVFSTLASAVVQKFNDFSKNKFNTVNDRNKVIKKTNIHTMQFSRFNVLYKKYESIADRSYMGGLNSSFYMGICSGYTFIDIDFKNAYPTAMNLLKIGDFGEKIVRKKYEKTDLKGLN